MAEPYNRHHLVPINKGGKHTTTILLNKVCHDKIHTVFTETELKLHFHTIEQIQQNESITSFINWVQRKEPAFYNKSIKVNTL